MSTKEWDIKSDQGDRNAMDWSLQGFYMWNNCAKKSFHYEIVSNHYIIIYIGVDYIFIQVNKEDY